MDINPYEIAPPMKKDAMQCEDGSVCEVIPGRTEFDPLAVTYAPYGITEPYELVALSVVSAIGQQIMQLFPGIPWHREALPAQLFVFPNFFVNQLTLNFDHLIRNKWWVRYLVTVRYRHVSDPAVSFAGLNEALDRVSLQLADGLDKIYWNDKPVKIFNARTEKVDGVSHWFGNIEVVGTKPIEEYPLMMTLQQNIYLKDKLPLK